MRTVTFSEIVPGMVLYPLVDVNSLSEGNLNFLEYVIVSKKVEAGENTLWGDRRGLHYLPVRDCGMGICVSSYHTGDDCQWMVVDDQETLDKIRAYVKKELNKQRDHIDECERLVDVNC